MTDWEISDPAPEDRIKARRSRIENRIKAAQRLHKLIKAQHVFGGASKGIDDDLPPVKTECENSKAFIDELIDNGNELVSNVRLASEHIHVQHHQRIEEKLKNLHAIINKEDEETKVFYEAIESKWNTSEAIPLGAPTELYHKIMEQNKACNELLGKRNDLIDMLESEIQDSDDQYRMLISEFHENIEVLTSRMEEQVQNLERVITHEWTKMERVFENQRESQLKKKDLGWNAKLETLNTMAEDKLLDRLNILSNQQSEIDKMINDDAEIYNELKMETEESIADLTDQIHMMDAVHQLNEEKLDYEIHVLRKHEEENVHVKSEQKRKIASLQDNLNKVKLKIQDRRLKIKNEEASLILQIGQNQTTLRKLKGKKQNLVSQSHNKKREIFKIVAKEIFGYLEKISDMEYLLSKLYGPVAKPDKIKIKDSDYVSRCSSGQTSSSSLGNRNSSGGEILHIFHTELKDKTFKSMLANLVQEVHFLVEENLGYLIDTIPEDERNLFKLDSILNVLGVECEEEILTVLRKADTNERSLSATYTDLLKILRQYVDTHHQKKTNDENKTLPISEKSTRGHMKNTDFFVEEELNNIREAIDLLSSSKILDMKASLMEYLKLLKERTIVKKENKSISRVNQELKCILSKTGTT